MALFAVGSFALWWATATGWSNGVFRVFFTAGAVLNVSWLALGSLALHFGDRVMQPLRRVLSLLSTFAIGLMMVAPTTRPFISDEFPRARDHFGVLPRTLAAVGSGLPALVIIVGALWSIGLLIVKRTPTLKGSSHEIAIPAARLVVSNVLIALGTLVLSGSGSLAGRFGEERAFTITLSLGVVILFVGFLVPSRRTGPYLPQFAS